MILGRSQNSLSKYKSKIYFYVIATNNQNLKVKLGIYQNICAKLTKGKPTNIPEKNQDLKNLSKGLASGWLHTHNAGGLGSISGQGIRSHMLQLKILSATTKNQHSQIKKYFFNNNKKF